MVAPSIRILVTTVGGIGFGLALGFGIAFAWAETLVVDGIPQRIVRFEASEPRPGANNWDFRSLLSARESDNDFPRDLVPYRVVKNLGNGGLLVECLATDLGWRLGLLYAIGGAVLGVALGLGADPSKVMATGLISASLFWFLGFPFLNSPSQTLPFVAMIVGLALMAACGEAVYSVRAKRRHRPNIGPAMPNR